MAYDLEEQEKLDALKDWWDRYGNLIVLVVVVIAASVLGWRGWQWYQGYQAQQAMGYYEALEQAIAQPQDDADALVRIKKASQVLQDDYAKSAYTSRGLLLAASALQERGETTAAKQQLQWLLDQNHDSVVVAVARLRLAALMLDEGDFEQGLALLEVQQAPGFEGLYADRRGDLYYAQGSIAQAQESWEQALNYLQDQPSAVITQLKLDALNKE